MTEKCQHDFKPFGFKMNGINYIKCSKCRCCLKEKKKIIDTPNHIIKPLEDLIDDD